MNRFGRKLGPPLLAVLLLSAAAVSAWGQQAGSPLHGEAGLPESPFGAAPALHEAPPAAGGSDSSATSAGNVPLALPSSELGRSLEASSEAGPSGSSGGGVPFDAPRRSLGVPGGWTGAAALCIVLILILGVARLLRRHAARVAGLLPDEAVELLGRKPLDPKHTLHLLRVGGKLLVVGASAQGLHALGEVADEAEADRLAGLCRQSRPNSSTASFRSVLEEYGTTDEDAEGPRHRIGAMS